VKRNDTIPPSFDHARNGLSTPEHPINPVIGEARSTGFMAPTTVAPVWHTVVLVAAIVALSAQGAHEMGGPQHAVNRLQTYGFTAATELVMLGWIYIGLRLRRLPLRALIGSTAGGLRSLAVDLGFAMVFWIVSLMVLGSIGLMWQIIEAAVQHRPLIPAGGQLTPSPSQEQTLHTLTQLAPSSASEVRSGGRSNLSRLPTTPVCRVVTGDGRHWCSRFRALVRRRAWVSGGAEYGDAGRVWSALQHTVTIAPRPSSGHHRA
jgi:hypothetical protein